FYRALEQLLASNAPASARSSPPAKPPVSPTPYARLSAQARRGVRRARSIAAASRDRMRPRAAPTGADVPQASTLEPAAPAPLPMRRRAPRPDCDPRVVDVAVDVGLGFTTRTFGAVVFDYDGDGWPDIFLGRHDEAAFLFRN